MDGLTMVVLMERNSEQEKFQFIQNQGWENPDNNSNEILLFNADCAFEYADLAPFITSGLRVSRRKENYFAMLSFCLGQGDEAKKLAHQTFPSRTIF